jgi:HSP20 family molecular chaperone IbpA
MNNPKEEQNIQETHKEEIVTEGPERTRSRLAFTPRTDIYETDDSIIIISDMPGVGEDSVNITLEKNVLTINGYVNEDQPEDYTQSFAEYRVGDYYRRFTLSNLINQENIEASVKDGVLRLTMPKVVPTTKQIMVKAG